MKKITLLPILLLCVGMGSCSLFDKNVKTDTQLPSDRHGVSDTPAGDAYASPSLDKALISGDWLIETVNSRKAEGQETPYLKFEPSSGMVYGSNGCNTINANYVYNAADSTLSFQNMITTMRACPGNGLTETAINTALASTARYTLDRKGDIYALTLFSAQGTPLMTLSHQNFDFLNGSWRVVQIEGENVKNEDMQLVFDIPEMKVHGNTGCNVLNGSLVTDMAERGSISFQGLATTRMMCPDIQEETALLVGLEAVACVKPVDNNTVELLNARGGVVLRLVRE